MGQPGWLLTGDLHDAEDVVQTALARLCQHWDRVRRSDDVDAYVRRSVVNDSHSRFRRRRVPTVPLAAAAASVGVTAPGLTAVEDRAGLAAALASLPGRQRQVLVLRFVEDLSEQATADALGCSVGTVKSTASRGLARLRDLLVVRARQERADDEPARPARRSCPAGAIRPAGGCRPPTTELHVRSCSDP